MACETPGKLIPFLDELDGKFVVNEEVYEVFNYIGERELAVYSINGKRGTGKSFMFNCFLSYLENRGNENWLKDSFINGFKSGMQNHTIGICMWSKPYLIPYKGKNNGKDKEVAIILFDTQGGFEDQSSFIKSAIVSTMSVCLSSFYIYNADVEVYKDDYMFLRLITKFAASLNLRSGYDVSASSFQNLLFLLRNQLDPALLGNHSADSFEKKNDEITNLTPENIYYFEDQFTFDCIRNFFTEINFFALPYPGKAFTCQDEFNGCIDTKNEELVRFFKYVDCFVTLVLDDNKIVVKKHGTSFMTANEFLPYTLQCIDMCEYIIRIEIQSNLPVIKTKCEVEAITTLDTIMNYYKKKMSDFLSAGPFILSEYESKHYSIANSLLEIFEVAVSDNEHKNKYVKNLKWEIGSLFKKMRTSNVTEYEMKVKGEKLISLGDKLKQWNDVDEMQYLNMQRNYDFYRTMIQTQEDLIKQHDEDITRLSEERTIVARKFGRNFLYKMESKPRGFCIIINNLKYSQGHPFSNRAEADTYRLRGIFTQLFFEVRIKDNLSAIEIQLFLKKISSIECRQEHDALVVIISSQVADEFLIGSDGEKLKIMDILEIFNNKNCQKLMGKPKMLFFLSYRGDATNTGISNEELIDESSKLSQINIREEASSTPFENTLINTRNQMDEGILLPTEEFGNLAISPVFSDMLICYSSTKSNEQLSVREKITGTWLGQELCNVLDRHANKFDLETMLKMLAAKVFQKCDSGLKVSIESIGWLKYLYFNSDI